MLLSNFQWYRRMRGGKWSRVNGFMWGRRWAHLSDCCIERVEEDWRNVAPWANAMDNDICHLRRVIENQQEALSHWRKLSDEDAETIRQLRMR